MALAISRQGRNPGDSRKQSYLQDPDKNITIYENLVLSKALFTPENLRKNSLEEKEKSNVS